MIDSEGPCCGSSDRGIDKNEVKKQVVKDWNFTIENVLQGHFGLNLTRYNKLLNSLLSKRATNIPSYWPSNIQELTSEAIERTVDTILISLERREMDSELYKLFKQLKLRL